MRIVTEWLVRRVDRVGIGAATDAKMTKRGDVVVVREAPCTWSERERENEDWIIVQSDMTMNDAVAYLEPEPGEEEQEKGLHLKIRNKGLLLDDAVSEMATIDPSQQVKIITPYREPFIFTKELIDQFTLVKPPTPRRF